MIWPYFERHRGGFVSMVLLVLFLLVVGGGIVLGAWEGYSAAHKRIQDTPDPPTKEVEALRKEKNDIPEYPIGKSVPYVKLPLGFNYITVDGHQYLMFNGYRQFGMTHSPKCPCHNSKEER